MSIANLNLMYFYCELTGDELVKSQKLTGCCPNKNSFERSLKRFVLINLGEAEDK